MSPDKKVGVYGTTEDGDTKYLPVKTIQVICDIFNTIANVCNKLVYENNSGSKLECAFTFPLDDSSALYYCQAEIGGKIIEAEIQSRAAAQETYERAIEMTQTAFLVEEDERSSDVFQIRLGNMNKDETIKITLKYSMEMTLLNDYTSQSKTTTAASVMLLSLPTVLNPRYDPNPQKANFSDALLLNANDYDFSFVASIHGLIAIVDITGGRDQYLVTYENKEHTTANATLVTGENFKKDHDIELFIHYSQAVQSSAVYEEGISGTLSNHSTKEASPLFQTDVVMLNFFINLDSLSSTLQTNSNIEFIFLIDQSGSMSGKRIKKARDTLLLLLKSLPIGCYFQVIGYGSNFHCVFSTPVVYDKDNLKKALRYQEDIEANMGGTEILRPLENVFSKSIRSGFTRKIFLLTDGDVGNVSQIIDLVSKNSKNSSVFTVGIGDGANRALVKGVARAGKGRAEFVQDTDKNFSGKILNLLGSATQVGVNDLDLQVTLPKGVSGLQVPKQLRPIFGNQILTTFLVLKGDLEEMQMEGSGKAVLQGKVIKEKFSFSMSFHCNKTMNHLTRDLPLHRLAAKHQIQELTDDGGPEAEIVSISEAFNVLSVHTAFIGVDRNEKKPLVFPISSGYDSIDSFTPTLRGCGLLEMHTQMGVLESYTAGRTDSIMSFSKSKKKTHMPSLKKLNPFAAFRRGLSISKPSGSILAAQSRYSSCDEAYVCSAPNPQPSNEHEMVINLARFQDFDGHWSAMDIMGLIVSSKESGILKEFDKWSKDEVATLLVVVFFQIKCSPYKDEWKFLVEKAMGWLHSKHDPSEVDAAEKDIFKKSDSLFL